MIRKVDFLIVGTQKGGTTALSNFLSKHPNVIIPVQKELHFFDNEKIFKKREIDYKLYHDYFEPKEQRFLSGEATPIYMFWKPAAKRIFEYNPEIKLVFILRNPIERAYSNYHQELKKKREFLSFKNALLAEPVRRILAYPSQSRYHSYIQRGYYTKDIKRMMQFFPAKQMLFLKNEELLMNHGQTLNKVFKFLEIPEYNIIEQKVFSPYQYPPMRNKDKQWLQKKFSREIEELENLLCWDLSDWKN